jgi:DNA-binding CsgD family transcriptional regulator
MTARSALFQRLGRAYADPANGGAVLTGPAGVGKTRLGEELLRAAAPLPTARAVGHPATQSIPLGALAHLLPNDLSRDIGVSADDHMTLFHRARFSLTERAGNQRLVMLIDDVDQLDDTSLALLLPLTLDRAVYLIATIRSGRPFPSVITSLLKDRHLDVVEVPPLTHDEVGTLLHRVLDGPVHGASVQQLATLSGGNLQVLREMVHRAVEQGALLNEDDVWQLRAVPSSTTIEELVSAQLSDLDGDESEVMELLAVAGSLGLRELDHLIGRSVLSALAERGLITVTVDERRTRVALSHPMYDEVVRGRMHLLRERELQRRLADSRAHSGSRRREDLTQIALWRLETGGDVDVDVLITAARLALAGRDTSSAVRFAQAAADRGRGHDAALVQLEAAMLEADAATVERIVADCWPDEAMPQAHRAHLARQLASSRFWRGDLPAALDALQGAQQMLDEPAAAATVTAHRASLLANNGRPHDALQLVHEVGDVDDPRVGSELAVAESIASLSTGRFAAAIEAAHRGARRHADMPAWLARRGMAAHLINEAHALGYSGRFDEARTLVTDALVRARGVGARAAVVWFEVVLGEVERDSGRGHAAVRHFTAATTLAEHAEQHAALVWAWVGVAQGNLLLGNCHEAAEALRHADACSSPVATSQATRDRAHAWLLACEGDVSGARKLIAEVAETARHDGMWNFESGVVHDLVRFGDPAAAIDRLAEMETFIDGPYVPALAAHARAAATGDALLYDMAIGRFEAMDCLVLAAEAAVEAAELHQRAGDTRHAMALRRRAEHFVERAGGARTPGLLHGHGVEPLTSREWEIALLAADGITSKEIAAKLFVSTRTVESHLQRVYRKLGVTGRDQLAPALSSATAP